MSTQKRLSELDWRWDLRAQAGHEESGYYYMIAYSPEAESYFGDGHILAWGKSRWEAERDLIAQAASAESILPARKDSDASDDEYKESWLLGLS